MQKCKCLNGMHLKVLAMALMLIDHAWASLPGGGAWMTCVGRLAFPIFAFLIAEGFAHTHSRRRYLKRLLIFAVVSELPFNLMSGGWIYPMHQNVLFTLALAVALMMLIEWARPMGGVRFALAAAAAVLLGLALGTVFFVDYLGWGVVTVLVFYLSRSMPAGWLVQLLVLWYINCEGFGGMAVELGGQLVTVQAFALLALPLIWLYNGQPGRAGKKVRLLCYAFYPLHIVALVVAAHWVG